MNVSKNITEQLNEFLMLSSNASYEGSMGEARDVAIECVDSGNRISFYDFEHELLGVLQSINKCLYADDANRVESLLKDFLRLLSPSVSGTKIKVLQRVKSENITNQPKDTSVDELKVEFYESLNSYNSDVKRDINDFSHRLETAENRINTTSGHIVDTFNEELSKVKVLYANALKEIEVKNSQIDDILGLSSGRVIAGDFESSAAQEKLFADWLRYSALFFMLIMILVVGYTFWDTTKDDFSWQASVFRIALTLILSVPASYLARESTKHRQQQYSHLQTSLDLKTITPFMATLPEDTQHRLKAEFANRLFAAKDFSRVGEDSYLLNSHELLMELIKKAEFPSAKEK